jgi:hypothetical protein
MEDRQHALSGMRLSAPEFPLHIKVWWTPFLFISQARGKYVWEMMWGVGGTEARSRRREVASRTHIQPCIESKLMSFRHGLPVDCSSTRLAEWVLVPPFPFDTVYTHLNLQFS